MDLKVEGQEVHEPREHQARKGQEMKAFQGVRPPFIVACQAGKQDKTLLGP